MAEIRPFQGLRFSGKDLSSLVAPPYDVISPSDVQQLQAQSQHNITHLTRPAGDQPYNSAARIYREWCDTGVLVPDPEPSFYIYRQKFIDPDTGLPVPERLGLVCLLKLEEYSTGKVLPHENTLTAARVDRLDLLRATRANFESIQGLYADPDRSVESFLQEYSDAEPVIESIPDMIGSSHALERISDPLAVQVITELLADKPIFIADGHHRYETSLTYLRENPDVPGADSLLITLTAFEDEGLLVLPTHRLLRGFEPNMIDELPRLLEQAGLHVEQDTSGGLLTNAQFRLVIKDQVLLVTLPADVDLETLIPGPQSAAWKELDVTILHVLIIGKILGVGLQDLATTDCVSYTRYEEEARRKVESGEAQAAFLLPRPTVAQMKAVSEAGDKMPQKSTFFYPKLLSGLVVRDLAPQSA